VPGLKRCGFFTPPVEGADLRAAFDASCLRGALPPVDLRAVCLVRAMTTLVPCEKTGAVPAHQPLDRDAHRMFDLSFSAT
jgi:hypothetical protein